MTEPTGHKFYQPQQETAQSQYQQQPIRSLIFQMRLYKYDCSFKTVKKEEFNPNKKHILLLFTNFFFLLCVFASCLVNYSFNYSFVYSLFERALLKAFYSLSRLLDLLFFWRNIQFVLSRKKIQ